MEVTKLRDVKKLSPFYRAKVAGRSRIWIHVCFLKLCSFQISMILRTSLNLNSSFLKSFKIGIGELFCKRSDNEYLRHCGENSLFLKLLNSSTGTWKLAQTVNKRVWLCSNIAPSTKMGSGPILSTGCSLPSSALGHPILWNILIKLIFNSKILLWYSLYCEYLPVRDLNSSCRAPFPPLPCHLWLLRQQLSFWIHTATSTVCHSNFCSCLR